MAKSTGSRNGVEVDAATTTVQSFRRWWQPPRRNSEIEEHRTITFLELFYDLVFVVVISEIGHTLADDVSGRGVLRMVFLFCLVWLAWLNGSMYHDLHGQNDIRTRVFTFAQMFAVVAMAVFVHSAFESCTVGFALSFAVYELIVCFLWWRTGVHDPDHRPMSKPYSLSILASALAFGLSAFLPATPLRVLWVVGLLLTGGAPLITVVNRNRVLKNSTRHARRLNFSSSAVERFDLFTLIVLGEVIVGVVRGVAGSPHLNLSVGITGGFGMAIAFGLWWLYFDFLAYRKPGGSTFMAFSWLYVHVITTLGIVATGAAIVNAVNSADEPLSASVRLLLAGSVALTLGGIGGTMRVIRLPEDYVPLYRIGSWVTLAAALIILGLGFTQLAAIPLLGLVSLLMFLPVLYGVKVWVKVLGAERVRLE